MMLKIFRIFSRSKYITDLFIIVALLTALSIPFYSLTNHYTQILDIIGSHKIISINTPNTFIIDTSEQLYDSTKPSTLLNTTLNSKCNQAIDISWDYVSISKVGSNKCIYTVVYAYSNLTAVSKIMDLKIFGKLNEGSILVGVDIANSLSVRIGDILQVRNLNSVKLFKVTGYVNLGNIAIISYKDSPNFLSKHTLLLVFDYSRDTTSGGMKGLLAKRGIKVYSANSINAFIKDIGASLILIVRVWFIPILMIMLISNLIISTKYIASYERELLILKYSGLSNLELILKLLAFYSVIILGSAIFGISLGLILTQIVSKILFILFRITLVLYVGINQFFEVLILTILFNIVGAIVGFIRGIKHVY